MPYCPRCGYETRPDDSYCEECGEVLPDHEPRQPRTQQSTRERKTRRRDKRATPDKSAVRIGQVGGILSAVVGLIGVFMPWLEIEILNVSESVAGTDYRLGVLVLILALVGGLLSIPEDAAAHGAVAFVGCLIALAAIGFINDPLALQADLPQIGREITEAVSNVGFGPYMSLVGGIGMIGSGLVSVFGRS